MDTQAFAGIEFHYPRKSKHVGGDHAAKWETSYLWYLRPDCVDMSIYLGREAEPLVGVAYDTALWLGDPAGYVQAVLGG